MTTKQYRPNYIDGHSLKPLAMIETIGFEFSGLITLWIDQAESLLDAIDAVTFGGAESAKWLECDYYKIEGLLRRGDFCYTLTYGALETTLSDEELADLQQILIGALAENKKLVAEYTVNERFTYNES